MPIQRLNRPTPWESILVGDITSLFDHTPFSESFMPSLKSAQPSPELRPFVRAYAQRTIDCTDVSVIEPVPAQLEQVLNFELGVMPGVRHRQYEIFHRIFIGGAQTSFTGYMDLHPGVESFAIFFQPAGWSQLFSIPMCEITNHVYDASAMMGSLVRELWNRLGAARSFESRVAIVEEFLLKQVAFATTQDKIAAAANYLFHMRGAITIPKLASRDSLGLRQFERRFLRETGASPKIFARVARFQAALDARIASPNRSWVDIAHSFGYYDQMHMIHDFEKLGRHTPTHLVTQMGDVRPPALASAM